MAVERRIIHLDLDAFYCAVEEKRDPSLQGKAFAVGGRPEARGVVSSCSHAARKKGVRSAMPMSQALRLCPELIVIPGHYGDYTTDSRQVMARLKEVTPLVEQISIDEAFLDVSGLGEPAEEILFTAEDRDVNLIAMGAYGHHIREFILGSLTEHVMREATCPVLLYRY